MEANNSNMTRLGPLDILAKKDCKVHSLSVSDQHATLLLSHPVNIIIDPTGGDNNNNGKDEKKSDQNNNGATAATITKTISSILKLTIVPFHKQLLGSNPIISPQDVQNGQLPEQRNNLLRHDAKASEDIISFLSFYNFDPKSDSGAEYSYYEASPNSDLCTLVNTVKLDDDYDEQPNYPQNKDRPNNDSLSLSTWSTGGATEGTSSSSGSGDPAAMSNFGSFDIELISPASPHQIARAMPSSGHVLIRETPELYDAVVKPYIRSIVDGGGSSLSWIQNLIEVKKEKERLLANCEKFIITIDTKWRSHPPPLSTPRGEWYDHPSAVDLYCLGIVKGCGITCLRDLRGEHISLLKDIMAEGLNAIRTVYGVSGDQIRIFIHYQPQFYHFHVHFTRLENETGCSVERGHLVSDVIQNLEMDSEYYCKRVITYKLKKGGALQNLIENYVDESKVNAI